MLIQLILLILLKSHFSIQVTTKEVMFMLDSCPIYSGASISKLSPYHLRESLRCINPNKQDNLIKDITDTVNKLAARNVSHNINKYFCGANFFR